MKTHRSSLGRGKPSRSAKHTAQRKALDAVAASESLESVPKALAALREIPNVVVFRREPIDEMRHACQAVAEKEANTLVEAAWLVRNRTRQRGRRPASRSMGTTLRVKGLEFDHAVVLDPSGYNAQNLYVALTRGSKSLTVVSSSRTLTPVSAKTQAPRI
jgi:DNA helicase-2/ATP-dependent DNA helicase PcrA